MQFGVESWPHAPLHRLGEQGVYFVTAGTYHRQHLLRGARRLEVLQRGVISVAAEFGWVLEAWAVFSNHYHLVAHSPCDRHTADSLPLMLGKLHARMGRWVNQLDAKPKRKVWHNYWETRLTYEKSYFARLNYTHQNAVKHGLVAVANLYPRCSAGWFERTARPAQVKTIYGFEIDRLAVYDEYQPAPEW